MQRSFVKLLLPATLEPDARVSDGVVVATYDPTHPIPARHHDAEALVLWGTRHEVTVPAATDLPNLRWVQSLGAGVDGVLAAGFAPSVRITSGRGLHDGPVAEHTLALMLAAARQMHRLRYAQKERRWRSDLGGVQPQHEGRSFSSLHGARVLVWGFGSIAAHLAPMLHLLGAKVRGVARRAGRRAGVRVHVVADLPALLPRSDVLVCILPSTPSRSAS